MKNKKLLQRFKEAYRVPIKTFHMDNFICIEDGMSGRIEQEDERLKDDDIPDLVWFLKEHPEIESVILCNNSIRDEGATLLAGVTTIKKLDLSNNYITNIGAKALAANTTLTYLDVSQNYDIKLDGRNAIMANTTLNKVIFGDHYDSDHEADPRKRANFGRALGIQPYSSVPSLVRLSAFAVKTNLKIKSEDYTKLPSELESLLNKPRV